MGASPDESWISPPRGSGERRTRRRGFRYALGFHGATGLTARLPSPSITPVDTDAVSLRAKRLDEPNAGEPATLITLGPLTNVAGLLRSDPGALVRSGGLIPMGGAVHRRGNVTPLAEFNVWNDPEAARTAFGSGANITFVWLDVCEHVRATRADAERAEPLWRRMLFNWFGTPTHPARAWRSAISWPWPSLCARISSRPVTSTWPFTPAHRRTWPD